MRLYCEIEVWDRNLSSLYSRPAQKPSRASLILGFPPDTTKTPDNVSLLLCTAQKPAGVKYKVNNNEMKVFGRFVCQGKATIRCDQPPHDLFISKADPLELKSFLKVMQHSVTATPDLETLCLPRLLVPRVRTLKTKLEIDGLREYRNNLTFPSTLRIVSIRNCRLTKIDSLILSLPWLEALDLSHNLLPHLPVEVGDLRVKEFRLQHNLLTSITGQLFAAHRNLCQHLQALDLSNNGLTEVPSTIGNLTELHTLNLSDNKLAQLPDTLCDLKKLKSLDVGSNCLCSLPGRIVRLKLDFADVSGNAFTFSIDHVGACSRSSPSLLEWAARSFLKSGLKFADDDLPVPVINYLAKAKRCVCNRLFVTPQVSYVKKVHLKSFCRDVVYTHKPEVLVSGVACSGACVSFIQT